MNKHNVFLDRFSCLFSIALNSLRKGPSNSSCVGSANDLGTDREYLSGVDDEYFTG